MRFSWVVLMASGAAFAQDKGEMRTKQVQGGYIRYEVLPGDDDQPPGQLFVVHEERTAPPSKATAQGADEEEEAPAPRNEARRPLAMMHRAHRGHAACDELRGKLAARLSYLRGLDVEPELARWIQQNLFFTADGVPAIQVTPDPLLVTALQSDLPARSYAEDLSRCEADGGARPHPAPEAAADR